MQFDELLNWKPHTDEVKQRCDKILNVMRAIAGLKWGASKGLLLTIYRACIRPLLDFGCEGLEFAPMTSKTILDTIQNKALAICCGSIRGTPTAALQVECGEPPLDLRRRRLITHLAAKTQLMGNNPTRDVYFPPEENPQWLKQREGRLRDKQKQRNPNGSGPYLDLLHDIFKLPPPLTPDNHPPPIITSPNHPPPANIQITHYTPTHPHHDNHNSLHHIHHKLRLIKNLTLNNLLSEWQSRWDHGTTGRDLHAVQPQVTTRIHQPKPHREKDVVISRLRMGHSRLNCTLHKLSLHPTGECLHCPGLKEDVTHLLTICPARAELHAALTLHLGSDHNLKDILTRKRPSYRRR